jgi:hypothetical protein
MTIPIYVGTYYHLGKLYEKENQKEEAISNLSKWNSSGKK